ncbi:MAG: anaerobic glycerol-3-phosphate dehydrogenase subunit GlpA [Anaerolineae bacterium]
MNKSTEVLVVGGGITGCGVLYDLARRGFKCALVERDDLATGTSGRFHGLLHSGGRYAVTDPEAARDCIAENAILRRIIPHCIEDTGGLFVTTPWDDPAFADTFLNACRATGIPVEEISIPDMLRREPLLNSAISRALAVPDASVETWEACRALVEAAAAYGAETLVYHQVVELLTRNGAVAGARVQNVRSGETLTVDCDLVVNAAGAWAGRIADMAGCPVTVLAGKGTMVAMNYRIVNTVVNRCDVPGDGDIIVPVGLVAVIGTTSVRVPDPDGFEIEDWEIQLMLDEGEKLVPGFKQFRALRAWAGVRPLYQETDPGADLRDVSRDYKVLDHAARDGVDNFITVVGGKWATFRKMAEDTVDAVCRKLGTERPCQTDREALSPPDERRYYSLGQRLGKLERGEWTGQVICECEAVTRPQIEARLEQRGAASIDDLRRDLRLGMGPCQGGFCTYRAAGLMHERGQLTAGQANQSLLDFLQERWKGVRPVLWGGQLRQMQLDEGIFLGLLGVDKLGPPPGDY